MTKIVQPDLMHTGEQRVRAIIEEARGRFAVVRLRTSNPAAGRLYERLGFERVDLADCTHTMAVGT